MIVSVVMIFRNGWRLYHVENYDAFDLHDPDGKFFKGWIGGTVDDARSRARQLVYGSSESP